MQKLGWICFSLVALAGPLWALPVDSSSDASSWLLAIDEDARLSPGPLSSWSWRSLPQSLMGLLEARAEEAQTGTSAGKADLSADSFKARERIQEAVLGDLPRMALLNRLTPANRKPFKKRGNPSECFWKYCV